MWRRHDAYPSGGDRLADGVGSQISIHERIRRSELLQPMHVPIADKRLSVAAGPALRRRIEIHRPREHPIALNGVEQMRIPREGAAQRARRWKKRMRGDDKPSLALAQARKRLERVDRLRGA